MSDRYYPPGPGHAQGVWKSSYEVANEMFSAERSAYPPGYAGHEPGTREKFGYGTPSPDPSRLSQRRLAWRDDTGTQESQRSQAVPHMQASDERKTFSSLDKAEIERSYRTSNVSPIAAASIGGSRRLSKTQSMPTMRTTTLRQKKPAKKAGVTRKLEDEEFSYFVPRPLQREPKEALMSMSLQKVHKSPEKRVSDPGAGLGTGFRTSCHESEWWPHGEKLQEEPTSYVEHYQPQPYFRMSPMSPYAGSRPLSAGSKPLTRPSSAGHQRAINFVPKSTHRPQSAGSRPMDPPQSAGPGPTNRPQSAGSRPMNPRAARILN